ncbi:MAG: RagB/SusD family nutrient uptake outer membrane protein [Gemmatimonadaceae bacterium]
MTTRLRLALPALILAAFTACDSVLETEPVDRVPSDREIVSPQTARAALIGAYDALQSLSYYGRTFLVLGDLSADNARHRGTFQYLGDVDRNQVQADNTAVTNVWGSIYTALSRVNTILALVPGVEGLTDTDRNEILGEAYFLRALHFHNLVKFWGDIPTPLAPVTNASEAAAFTRTPQAQVYDQILSDLDKAATLVTVKQTRQASPGAVLALRARVLLYKGDYAGALDAANKVLALGYTLATNYSDLFTADGTNTGEDILRITFTPQEYNELGYYYLRAGRREVGVTPNLNSSYETGDTRKTQTVAPSGSEFQGTKFPTTIGGEDLHVIRLAEVILIKAEALARLNQLPEAVTEYNKLRLRAKLVAHVFGTTVRTQAEVLAAIAKERRLELALEGDRWPDLVRTGQAMSVLALPADRAFQLLYPIPSREIVVAPGLKQNPGY